jgi:sortase A
VSLTSIDRGPSHWPGTAVPGQLGNVVVAGHRVTHSHPFRHLDDLGAGDVAIFTTPDGTFTYDYVSTEIVDPARVDIVNQTIAHTATFFACHPPGSARSRIVVHWQLEGETSAVATPGAGTITVTNP